MVAIKINCWRCGRELDLMLDKDNVLCATCGGRAFKIDKRDGIIYISKHKKETLIKVKCHYCKKTFEAFSSGEFDICDDCINKDVNYFFDYCKKRLKIKKFKCSVCNKELTKDMIEDYEMDNIDFECKHCNSHIRIQSFKIYDWRDDMFEI